MATLRRCLRYRRARRANHRALNKERSERRVGEGQEIGYMSVGKGNKSKRHAGTPGGG
jgi:hypothetical protein